MGESSSSRQFPVAEMSGKKANLFGTALLAENVIDTDQLEHALQIQRDKSEQFGENALLGVIVVELGYATETEIVQALNEHFDIPVRSLEDDIEKMIQKQGGGLLGGFTHVRIRIWIQLSIFITLIIVAASVTQGIISLERQKQNLYQQTQKIGTVSLNYFANNSRIPLLEDKMLELNILINEATTVEGLLYAFITDREQRVVAHTDHQRIGSVLPAQVRPEQQRQGDVSYYQFSDDAGQQVLNLSRAVTFKDKELGVVQVGVSIDFIEMIIRQERLFIIWMTLISIVLGLLVAILLGKKFSRPISRLVAASKKITSGNYRHKVYLKVNDELGDLATAFNDMSEELWLKGLMQNSFGKYVGADVLKMIIENPSEQWLRGQHSSCAVVFTDIRGFTAYCESRDPEEVVEHLNEYFSISTQVIHNYGGYVDKFIGDAVLGVFGVPVYHKDYTYRAVSASLEIQRALQTAAQDSDNELLGRIGIGISSGVAVSGNIGSQEKMEYTVIGDTVNVASRLNSLAAEGEVIIDAASKNYLGDIFKTEALPPTELKGKSEPVTTYRVLGINHNVAEPV